MNCPICDRPPGDQYKLGATVCERFSLEINGLVSRGATEDCKEHRVDWRKRTLEAHAVIADLRAQLAAAQRALSRHHAAAHAKHEPFRDNARIE